MAAPCASSRRARDGGFTLTELMVTVVIVSILTVVALPLTTRDRHEAESREFASSVARDLQRSRGQAVADRLPVHVYVYTDRLEFRQARLGVLPGDPPIPPALADAPLRVLRPRPGMRILDVTTAPNPPGSAVLTTATFKEIAFEGMGRARFVGNVDQPMFIWIESTDLRPNHPYRRHRVDVAPLTGFIQLRQRW